MQRGKCSISFEQPPIVASCASIAGKKEGEGPLGPLIDVVEQDEMFGTENWEQAESAMQKQAADLALELIATSFGTVDMEVPLFGLYGACSTMAEALCLGAMTVHGGYADKVLCVSSSHFATAEKQFRFPLAYGNQRPFSATWTLPASFPMACPSRGCLDRVASGLWLLSVQAGMLAAT